MNSGANKLNYPKDIPSGAIGARTREAIARIIDPLAFQAILPASHYNALKKADAILALSGPTRGAVIEECARLIESGAGMADLINQDDLDQQAKYIRALASAPALSRPDSGGAA